MDPSQSAFHQVDANAVTARASPLMQGHGTQGQVTAACSGGVTKPQLNPFPFQDVTTASPCGKRPNRAGRLHGNNVATAP